MSSARASRRSILAAAAGLGLTSVAACSPDTNQPIGTPTPTRSPQSLTVALHQDGRAQVQYNADNLLSVATWIGSYSSGAAHPNSYGAFMSFDLESGERLQLKDVITPEGKETVKAELLAAIERTKDDADTKALWVGAATSLMSQSSNVIEDFTIAKTGLRFRLDNHVAHVMQGAVRDSGYIVPFAKIKQFIKPGTSIAKLAGVR